MKRKFLKGIVAMFLGVTMHAQTPVPTQTAPNQPQLIEKVIAKPGELAIAYEKWRLPNGLVVIVHEDHSDPIVHVDVTYHVGSARETPGKSGFAHFFEHMMFQGSDHVADEEHFKIVEGAGGDMNGTTNRDRTNYFETLPKNYLETAIWLEADRMGYLLDAVTQKKFEVQRATVKNEKDQRVTNVPYGRTDEVKDQILYPAKHPYNWPTIGYVEDLDRVNVEDLKNFFMRWYGPNNASLVVAGDVDPKDVVNLAMKYFGPIPRGPEVKNLPKTPVRLPDNVYANYGDNIFLPLTYFVYPGVANYHPDEAPLDILASILGDGNNSWLYQKLVKTEKAFGAECFNPCFELAGEFTFQILAYPAMMQEEPANPEDLLKSVLDEFDRTGITDEELARAKAKFETQAVQSLQSIGGKAAQLSMWNYLLPNKSMNVQDEINRYNKVSKEDVMRVFRTYIKGKYAAIVNVFPKDANAASTKEETNLANSSGVASSELEYKGLSYTKPKDNFDRSKKPEIKGSVTPVVPKIYSAKFDNGMNVLGTQNSELPLVTIMLTMKGGNVVVNDPAKSGLALLTAFMMGESTQNYTSEQFNSELDKLGSSISFNAGKENTSVMITSQKKNLDKTLQLFEEALLRPKYTAEDFKLKQRQLAEQIKANSRQAGDMAGKAYSRLLYGKSIFAEPATGSIKTIKGMSIKDVQSYYDKYYSPSVASLVIVGDVAESEIMPKLQFLKNWGKKEVILPKPPVAEVQTKQQIYLIDKYKATQTEIRVGYLALPYDYNGKFFKSNVMNYPLGGNFNSRLNLNLREEKGITYGIRSSFQGTYNPGTFTVGVGVRASATDTAIKEIMNEMVNYRAKGITEEELAYAKKSLTQSDALRYETIFDKAGFLNQIAYYNLPTDYIEQQNKTLQEITKQEIDALAKEMLAIEKMVIVVIGDKDKIKSNLDKLDFGGQPGYKSPLGSYKVVELKPEE
ncbi:MAG: M16 family metallopeptidase [Bacteroidota bacterium]|jgi:zinc protease